MKNLFALLFVFMVASNDPAFSFNLNVSKASSTIDVDGVLDEQAWKDALTIGVDYEWYPGENLAAPVKTQAKITFNQKYLYVAFIAEDPDPSKIRASYGDRDKRFEDDTVGLMIDTFNDQRTAYQFRINPMGVQMDAVNSDANGSEDWAWDAIWHSAGKISDSGFVVEISIPFSQLRFPNNGDLQKWRVMFMRDFPRSDRHRMRSVPTDRNMNCFICQFPEVTGFTGMKPGLNLQVTPTLTGIQTNRRDPFPEGELSSGDMNTELGGTVRWSISPNATVTGTVNPDFSQVEADDAQLDINNRFALFFAEKRPFFLEGADFFQTPINAVFTRTVADPEAGLKFTAKQGKNTLGVFYAQDRINNFILPSNEGSQLGYLDETLDSGVIRYRRDIGRNSNIGMLLTSRIGEDYENLNIGIDGNIRLTDRDRITFQYLATNTTYEDEDKDDDDVAIYGQKEGDIKGDGYDINYRHSRRNWSVNAATRSFDPEFRADFGFVPRVGYTRFDLDANYTFFGSPGQWYRRIIISAGSDITEIIDGDVDENGQDLALTYQGNYQSHFRLGIHPNKETLSGQVYNNTRYSFDFSVVPSSWFSGYMNYFWGENIDSAHNREGESDSISAGGTLKLGRRFESRINYNTQTFDVAAGELFNAELLQANLNYNINLRTFIRGIVQYTDISRNTDLYLFDIDEQSENLFTQLLFSYKINPQSVFLLGYSDVADGNQLIDLTKRNQTFFVKLGYAWVR